MLSIPEAQQSHMGNETTKAAKKLTLRERNGFLFKKS
jgi:hypothetical protein